MAEETQEDRIDPRLSAFEALLPKVNLDLWTLRKDPTEFADAVEFFVSVFLDSDLQKKLREKSPELNEGLDQMEARIRMLEKAKIDVDPFTEDAISRGNIPAEEAGFARVVWHAVVDVIKEAGLWYRIRKPAKDFALDKLLKGGE